MRSDVPRGRSGVPRREGFGKHVFGTRALREGSGGWPEATGTSIRYWSLLQNSNQHASSDTCRTPEDVKHTASTIELFVAQITCSAAWDYEHLWKSLVPKPCNLQIMTSETCSADWSFFWNVCSRLHEMVYVAFVGEMTLAANHDKNCSAPETTFFKKPWKLSMWRFKICSTVYCFIIIAISPACGGVWPSNSFRGQYPLLHDSNTFWT